MIGGAFLYASGPNRPKLWNLGFLLLPTKFAVHMAPVIQQLSEFLEPFYPDAGRSFLRRSA